MPSRASVANEPSRLSILGAEIDLLTMNQAIAKIEEFLHQDEPKLIFTADASAIYMSTFRADVKEIFQRADVVTADGSGVVWAADRLGSPVPEKVSGIDLAYKLFELSHQKGYRIYCLGAAPKVAEAAAAQMLQRYPSSQIVGCHDGYFKPDEDEAIAEEIAKAEPDILLVAMGIPRQETFILKTQRIHKARVSMGIGGSFDVMSGRLKRAPKIFQALKLEWLWRVCQDPKKMGRIKMLPLFVREVRRQAK